MFTAGNPVPYKNTQVVMGSCWRFNYRLPMKGEGQHRRMWHTHRSSFPSSPWAFEFLPMEWEWSCHTLLLDLAHRTSHVVVPYIPFLPCCAWLRGYHAGPRRTGSEAPGRKLQDLEHPTLVHNWSYQEILIMLRIQYECTEIWGNIRHVNWLSLTDTTMWGATGSNSD